jgi:hypothetical protein
MGGELARVSRITRSVRRFGFVVANFENFRWRGSPISLDRADFYTRAISRESESCESGA